MEPTSSNNKFKNADLCKHRFCQCCIAKYIQVKVKEHTAEIKCPELSCRYHLEPLACRHIISRALFTAWCDLLCENSVVACEKSYCPNRDCMELVVNECGSKGNYIVKKCKCPNCKQTFCFQCRSVWHAGYLCEEREELIRDRNDVLFGQLVEVKKWIRCPRCAQCVELFGGCSRVMCRCKTLFCYECGKEVTRCPCHCDLSLLNITLAFLFLLIFMIFLVLLVELTD